MEILSENRNIQDILGSDPVLSCTIRITDKCNLHCKQCYSCSEQNSKAYVLSYEEIATLLYDFKKIS